MYGFKNNLECFFKALIIHLLIALPKVKIKFDKEYEVKDIEIIKTRKIDGKFTKIDFKIIFLSLKTINTLELLALNYHFCSFLNEQLRLINFTF